MKVSDSVVRKYSGTTKEVYGKKIDSAYIDKNNRSTCIKKFSSNAENNIVRSNLVLKANLRCPSANQRKLLNSKIELGYSFNDQIGLCQLENAIIDIADKSNCSFDNFLIKIRKKFLDKKYTPILNSLLEKSELGVLRLESFAIGVLNNSEHNKKYLEQSLSLLFKIDIFTMLAWNFNFNLLCMNNIV